VCVCVLCDDSEEGCGSGPSFGSVLLRGLALFRLILLSSLLESSRALKTLAAQPVDMVYSRSPKDTDTYTFSNTDTHTGHAGVSFQLECQIQLIGTVCSVLCSLSKWFSDPTLAFRGSVINRGALPSWASYKPAEFSAHF